MANVNITVFEGAAEVALGDPIQNFTAEIDGAASAAITSANINDPNMRRRCRIYSESSVWIAWGANPTVTGANDGVPLGADNPEYFDIQSGHKIIAITR